MICYFKVHNYSWTGSLTIKSKRQYEKAVFGAIIWNNKQKHLNKNFDCDIFTQEIYTIYYDARIII